MLGPLPDLGAEAGQVQRGNRVISAKPSNAAAIRWLLSTALLIVIVLVLFQFIKATIQKIPQQQQARAQAAQQAAARASLQASALPTPVAPRQTTILLVGSVSACRAYGRRNPDPCHELIDWRSGTYIDHCKQGAPHSPTAAEIRESQRKADEAIKVIEASTPDM
jgi:hypothetical protein